MSNSVVHVKQQGVVLVALAVSMLLVSGATLLASQLLIDKRLQAADEITVSLAKAKEALISYAVTYADNYGHNTRGGVGRLPCPAISPHGSPATRCGKSALGYLPAVWSRDGKRIDIDYREYFLNQNLWYAVSSEFRYNPSFNHLNPAVSDGLFKIGSREDIVAVILHPGSDLNSGQSDSNTSAVHQLHSENADGDTEFIIGAGVNDRLITIAIDELMPLMERRVLGIVNDWLLEYYQQNQHYPYAAQLGDPQSQCVEGLLTGAVAMSRGNCTKPALGELVSAIVPKGRAISDTWFGRYDWNQYIYYQVDTSCTVATEVSGCLADTYRPALTVDSKPASVLLVSVGKEMVSDYTGQMQNRLANPQDRASYMDTAALVDADLEYQLADLIHHPGSNDQFLVLR